MTATTTRGKDTRTDKGSDQATTATWAALDHHPLLSGGNGRFRKEAPGGRGRVPLFVHVPRCSLLTTSRRKSGAPVGGRAGGQRLLC